MHGSAASQSRPRAKNCNLKAARNKAKMQQHFGGGESQWEEGGGCTFTSFNNAWFGLLDVAAGGQEADSRQHMYTTQHLHRVPK